MLADQNARFALQSDQELAALVKKGDRDAFSALCARFAAVITGRAGRYSGLVGADVEDFVQEGLLALYRASHSYNASGRAGFRTYATVCIHHSMSAEIKKYLKHFGRKSLLPLDCLDNMKAPGECYSADDRPEQLFLEQENALLRARQIQAHLSQFEQQVLRLYLRGQSYKQISKLLSTSAKSVDNALQRVRRKLR